MREIKFRAWDEENEVMVYNVAISNGKPAKPGYQWFSTENTVHNSQPLQFTGLKDKNGVEIYEGDIVRYEEVNYKIVFEVGAFNADGFYSTWQDVPYDFFSERANESSQVIGNIYENPDLLKGD